MKVAVIGNMNNNGFALMRYFRDLGADAHLFLYKNDGVGAFSHFAVEADTWNIEKWIDCIHRIDIENSLTSLQHSFVLWALRRVRWIRRRSCDSSESDVSDYMPIDFHFVENSLSGFDFIVCSGVAPAVLAKLGLQVDIYYPYSTGVEFIGNIDAVKRMSIIKRCYVLFGKRLLVLGLKRSRFILNAEASVTADVLRRYGLPFVSLAVPMIYNREVDIAEKFSPDVMGIADVIKAQDFVVFSHARNYWVRPADIAEMDWFEGKNTDWLICAFAIFLLRRPNLRSKLVLLEYGPDVEASKELINRLGIGADVLWLKKMPRRDLMVLLNYSTIGVGEFRTQDKIIWGGTGWEVLAAGKPLLQSLNFDEGQFQELFGYPPPPMLAVRKQDDILDHLLNMADHPEKVKEIGCSAKEWFNHYNGIGLANQWLDLLKRPRANALSRI